MNNLYDVFEVCLIEIENGVELETVLLRYPDLAGELRPILEASVNARSIAVPDPSSEIVRRNRAKVLQHAAQLRESAVRPKPAFTWIAPLRRVAATLAIILVVFASGTSLVGAASTSVPGDNLYGVKRSWETMQVFFTFNARTREALEVDHENERIEELHDLFNAKRSAEVTFSGIVTRQSGGEWLVYDIPVKITSETVLPGGTVPVDSPVRVVGISEADGSVQARSIVLLPPGASLPEIKDKKGGGADQQNDNGSDSGPDIQTPMLVITSTPEVSNDNSGGSIFDGNLDVLNTDFWTINGESADISNAEIVGTPSVDADVKVDGYFNSEGRFIVTKIEFLEDPSNNSNDTNSNVNDNNNRNDNSNDNGDDNSGSGKGGSGGGGNGNDNGSDDNGGGGGDH